MFLAVCYKCGLNRQDLDDMTIGSCFDYINEYIELMDPKKEKTRKASQNDMDSF